MDALQLSVALRVLCAPISPANFHAKRRQLETVATICGDSCSR
jgi:hypothetical protein